jgi:gamma-glutamyl hercynylcysteine S-oxide synthase
MQPATNWNAIFARARAHTDFLFDLVRPEAMYDRPIPERHRIIFYLGHLEAFDWNQVCREVLGMESFHPSFDKLFAFGIDPAVGRTSGDQPGDWPTLEEVRSYNGRVREVLDSALARVPEDILHVAIEHRLMHAETFAYMLHNLPFASKVAPPCGPEISGRPPRGEMIEIPAGRATLGRARSAGFGWDNEFEEQTEAVPAFAISRYKVTNGDYLEFVEAGAKPPHFWSRRGERWMYRGMFGEMALPLDWPVYVTREEADAYALWKGMALPGEAQFHRAAFGTPEGIEREYPWGVTPPGPAHGNFDFRRWDPEPVTASPGGDSAFGVSQMVGNGWEWTSTVFGPFPGFAAFPFYPGYSADFFDADHYVIKGGSARTAAPLLRRSFRNWFRGGYPYLYAGFRLVEN